MASIDQQAAADTANEEAIRAWDGPLFDRFLRFQHLIEGSFARHGEAAIALLEPRPGERALDIGCGFGDTTERLAGLVAPGGVAVGLDAAPRFIEHAREAAAAHGVANAEYAVADIQTLEPGEPFDLAFSRFGTMFFANPVAALRNVRRSLVPAGRIGMVVWRRREDNDWLYRAQTIVESIVSRPQEYDEPTCGPGPFSMAGADTLTGQLRSAGFHEITLRRHDALLQLGASVDRAVQMNLALGPAAEALRLAGERGAEMRPQLEALLTEALAQFMQDDGDVRAQASTWIATARA